ncbi:MAG TPA: DMT family transporter, partial [Candidatus Nocardiopsis merdipullorum]|nr:DMT family transporter [Candidatus Nocardiopsis merdipullorum]
MTRRTTVRGFGRNGPGRANRDEAGSSGPGQPRSGWWGSLVVAVVVGMVVPVQARVNGELGRRLEDGLAAALLSFAGGLFLLIVFVLFSARLRRALGVLRTAVRDEGFPRWYLLAGTFGAVFALAQSTLTLLTGVAVFTVALLSSQAIGGLVVDARGIGGGVRRRPE